jgi:hypothetical protein
MRTRIALVAIVPIAVITVSLLGQLVSVQSARAAVTSPHPHRPAAPSAGNRTDRLTSFVRPDPTHPAATLSIVPALDLAAVLVAGRPAGTEVVAPAPAPAPVPVDTVTPAQRAAWERVAMCEEGGNWQADGPRFSGGLGITRANWAAYGGLQYAPSGALATPDQQIMVAERIQGTVPDQYGCRGW